MSCQMLFGNYKDDPTHFFSASFIAHHHPIRKSPITGRGWPLYGDDIEEPGANLRLYTFVGAKICFGPEFITFGKHETTIDGDSAELSLWGAL